MSSLESFDLGRSRRKAIAITMQYSPNKLALRASLIYSFVAGVWILLSDQVLTLLVTDPNVIGKISIFKGWVFVAVTAAILYFVLLGILRLQEKESAHRQRAEKILFEQTNQYRKVVELSTHAIFVMQDERFVQVNSAAVRLFGATRPEQLLGRLVFDFVHKDYHEIIHERSCITQSQDKPLPLVEQRFIRLDGSLVEVETTSTRYQFDERPALLIEATGITERKIAGEKVRQLSQAVEQSPVSVVITDTKGRIEYINRKFSDVTGYSLEEVLGKNPSILKSRNLPVEAYQRLWKTINEGGTWAGELHNKKKNGEFFWEWATIAPVIDDNGKTTHFLGVKEDITERKNAMEALRVSEEKFRLLTENAPDLITVINGGGVIQFDSPSVERLLGYKPEELTNRSVFEFIHPEDKQKVTAAMERSLVEKGLPVSVEFRFRHHNSSWHILQATGKRILNRTNEDAIVVNSRDVTENRRLEDQLRQSQKMEAIGQLAGGVAHDFNNILAVIQMQAGLMEAAGALLPIQQDYCKEIGKATQRAANLTRQLLLFSRKQELQPRDLNLNDVVTNITKMLQRILGEDVHLQFNYSPETLIIRADIGMIEQILVNLAVNSRDAMPKGGRLVIETSSVEFDELSATHSKQARAGAFVCLSVSDTGCGIPPEILPKIFEPFFTTKDVGKGTGLGLATVFGIVQQHQGWINLYSEVGHGTTLRVYLPLISKNDIQHLVSSPKDIPVGNETILLVEDDPSLCALVQRVLTRLGYRILEAPSAASALKIWKQRRDEIQLLLTDLILPDAINGRELSRQLLRDNTELKVIYTSGYSADIAGKDFVLEEGVNFIAKPFQIHRLAQTIRARLDS